jgi:hypothetical protein
MIRAVFFASGNQLLGYHISGHAGYEESGKDIVCAFVSSAAYMTANTITEVMGVEAQAEADEGDMMFRIGRKDAEKCKELLEGLRLHLLNTEEQYPQYLTVKTTEV